MANPLPFKLGILCSSGSLGGLELNLVRLAGWLKERDVDLVFFALKNSPIHSLLIQKEIEVTGIKPHWKYYDLKATMALRKKVKKNGVRVMLIRDNRDLSLAALVKSSLGGKMGLIYLQAMQLGVSKRDLLHTIRFRQIDRWISPLPYLARQAQNLTRIEPGRIKVIPLGLDLSRFSTSNESKETAREIFKLDPGDYVIGLIGRIDPMKGQHVVLEAGIKLRERGLNFKILFVGDPTLNKATDYYEALKRTTRESGMTEVVHFHPFIDRPELFYQAVDVAVVASEKETFGMVTVESMAAGCPTVGARSGGTAELLEHGKLGELFEPGNADELAEKLTTMMRQPGDAEVKAYNAQQSAIATFDHSVYIEKLLGVFEEVYAELPIKHK